MDRRRRGMICVGLGLGMLGGFVWFEVAPPTIITESIPLASLSSATTAELSLRETLGGNCESECLRLHYRGQGVIENLLGQKSVGWEVDVYRLPADCDGLIPHVVHVDKQQGSGRGQPYNTIEVGDSVTACWMDTEGRIVRSITPPGAPLPEIDPAAFLVRLPGFAARGRVHVLEGSNGSRWQMEATSDPSGDSNQVMVEVASDSVSQRVEQIDRHMRLCYDRQSRILLRMELFEQGHWRQKYGESQSQLELVEASEIPPGRVASMTADLKGWEKFHRWVRKIARKVSAPPRVAPPPSAESLVSLSPPAIPPAAAISAAVTSTTAGAPAATVQLVSSEPFAEGSAMISEGASEEEEAPYAFLDQLPIRTTDARNAMSDAVLRTGLAAGLYSMHASRSQLVGERDCVMALHRIERLTWDSTDLTGVQRSGADYRGKPLVMSFLCRGTPHATRTIRTVAALRRRFSEDEVAVVAFATTYSRENAEAISRAIGPTVPVFHDLGLAERVNLFAIGKSTLLVLDGLGKPRFVHTWQPVDLVDEICSQIEQLRSVPVQEGEAPANQALQQISLATP